ncbi:MAG: glycosyltransferase family 4 protein [Patescibacteria group bacterium]
MHDTKPKRKKVLYIITKSVWGGAQRYVFDLATHMPPEKWEALVATGGNGTLVQKLKEKNIRVIQIPALERDPHIFGDIRVFWKIFMLLRNESPDVAHLNSSKIGGIGALATWFYNMLYAKRCTLNAKIVFTAHGWAWSEDRPQWQRAIIIYATRVAAWFQDDIIILSRKDLASALYYKIPEQKLAVIPLGIPTPISFLNPIDAQKKITDIMQKKISRPFFGVIAELTRNKGIPYLVQALILLKYRGVQFSCALIGDGEEMETIRRMITENNLTNEVTLLGWIDNGSKYLKAFDAFVLPSIKEGLPYVLLEALAAEIPIVATTIGGIPDIIENGQNGILVPEKNPKALADALQKIARDANFQTQCSKNATKKFASFSFEAMLKKTVELYDAR